MHRPSPQAAPTSKPAARRRPRHALPAACLAALATVGCDRGASRDDLRVDVYLLATCPLGNEALLAAHRAASSLGVERALHVHHIGARKDGRVTSPFGAHDLATAKLRECAARHGEAGRALAFAVCTAARASRMPAGWEACAKEAQLPVGELRRCAEGAEGATLLRASVERSHGAGAEASPTILINGARYEGPREEPFLVEALCADDNAPPGCRGRPGRTPVDVALLSDPRCDLASCDVAALTRQLRARILGARIRQVAWDSDEGRALSRLIPGSSLPVAFLRGTKQTLGAAVSKQLRGEIRALPGTSERFVLPLGGTWDPRAELCSDGQDNDGDGRKDCGDMDCQHALACRAPKPNDVQVFGLATDPYSLKALEAALHVAAERQLQPPRLHHVGEVEGHELSSSRGAAEVEEAIRQACVQRAAGGPALLSFARCRSRAPAGQPWQACLPQEVSVDSIFTCVTQGAGMALVAESYRESQQLRLRAVPAVLLHNRHLEPQYTPDAIRAGLCKHATPGHACAPSAERPTEAP